MGSLGLIQESIGSWLLPIRTKWNDREPKVFSFENARTIGIVYNVENKDVHTQIADFANFLTQRHSGMQVSLLGFLDNPELEKCLTKVAHTEFFSEKDFSWSGRLQKGAALDFVKNRFDILLDISTETTYPVHYVQLSSVASYKVGRYIENDLRYDLLIDTKEDNSIAYLITQINVYLSKIKIKH